MRDVQLDTYGFAVDTKDYAGNFEREVVAFMTGQIGDCEVGNEQANKAKADLAKTSEGRKFLRWCERHVSLVLDDGCRRPAAIFPTPGWFNDGHGNAYPDSEAGSEAVAKRYVETVRKYHEPHIANGLKRIEAARAAGNEKDVELWGQAVERHRQDVRAAESRGPGRFPSYQSAIVWLDKRPPSWVVEILKARAAQCLGTADKFRPPVAITGYRVVKITKVTRWSAV